MRPFIRELTPFPQAGLVQLTFSGFTAMFHSLGFFVLWLPDHDRREVTRSAADHSGSPGIASGAESSRLRESAPGSHVESPPERELGVTSITDPQGQ